MEFNNKIGTLNTYDLITKFLQRPNITSHISKHLSSATMKPVDAIFTSVINDSFVILKFQESQKSSQYFKYLAYSNTYDRLDISSSKSIIDIGYNNTCFYYILSIGNTFSIITPENEINYETLILKDSIKLSNEIGKKYIIKISCGENHCLFLTHAGMIYTLGDNSYGQLGLGENHITKENREGVLLKDLLNYRINDICAGKNHSFCFGVVREMTKTGNTGPNNNIEFDPKRPYYLFGWGDNSFYQLGMKQNNTYNTILRPTKISCNNNLHNPAIIGEELININCGLNFSALLFRNGKLLTFGDNKYNQLIFKENETLPNFVNNYLPKKIGKIIKILTGGNSLMLMSEFNKLIIFGKFNEPNLDQITIVDLVDNCENNKYIFNDNILKLIIFNNELSNPEIIQKVSSVKIDEFLVNLPNKEIQKKNEKEVINETVNNKSNDDNNIDNINKNNEVNANNKNKNMNNKEIKNKTLDIQSSKKHLKMNSNLVHSSAKNNLLGEQKKQLTKNLNNNKNKTIKYKNSFTKISQINNNKKLITDTFSLFQSGNTKNKTQFNGAEKKSENSKILKTFESNGKSNQKKSNENSQELKIKEEIKKSNSQNINEKDVIDNKVNGNNINENENGNSNQNFVINQLELDNKTFLNKNIIEGKVPTIQNRYEETYDSFNPKEKNDCLKIDYNQTKDESEEKNNNNEQNKNNGGNLKNGKSEEQKEKKIKISEIENFNSNNSNKKDIKEISKEEMTKSKISSNLNFNKNINENLENQINNKKEINDINIDKNNKLINDIIINNKIEKKNIDNNISNNSIKDFNNFQDTKNEIQNKSIKNLQNLDNNSLNFNKAKTNNTINIKMQIKSSDNNKKEENNNLNNGINSKNDINKPKINNNEKNNKVISIKQNDNNNYLSTKKPEVEKFDSFRNKNDLKENIQKKSSNIMKNIQLPIKENTNKTYLPIEINSAEKNEESNNQNQTRNLEKKENINIFRELGQFVSSTMNKINKYTKNRSDIKKDSFFEKLITGNFTSNLRNINPKLLLNNIISGIPNRYRGRFWLKCIGNQLSITPDYFDINLSKYYEKYEDTKELKYKMPFPYLGIFKENTPLTSDLFEVINGFVISRPDIKYKENISYLVGMLIINMDKYQAYVSFMNLILNPNIIIYYLSANKNEHIMEYGYSDTPTGDEDTNVNKNKKIPSIVEKNLRRVIFKQLLFHNLPDLCSNLELIDVLPEDYFDEWNETIFCKNFNIDIAMKIWDLFVVQGEKIIFDAGIAIMKELEEELNNCEEKEEALNILLNSQMREINETNILKNMQKVEYPDWIQSEVMTMTEDTVIPVIFNKN